MYVLMAKIVYKDEVAIVVFSTLGLWFLVMHLQLLIIEECVFADRAYPALFPGDFLSTGWEIFGFRHVSPLPVVFERGVIW